MKRKGLLFAALLGFITSYGQLITTVDDPVDLRRLAGAARNADIAKRAVAFDTSTTLADGESLTLGFARGGTR